MSASLSRLARTHNLSVRQRIESLPTIAPDDPRLTRAKQLTNAYRTRQIDQCEALLSVIGDLEGKQVLLVKRESSISVWTGLPIPPIPQVQEVDEGVVLLDWFAGV